MRAVRCPETALPPVLLPPEFDPLTDGYATKIAEDLPLRDGDGVTLPADLTYVFIVFTNRSGSTYLGELLASTGGFNAAGEPLNIDAVVSGCAERGCASLSQYLARIAAEQAFAGHFVVKASISQLATLAHHGLLARILGRSRFVVVERVDKLAQAISWHIATGTGLYTSWQNTAAAAPLPEDLRRGCAAPWKAPSRRTRPSAVS